MTNRKQRPRPLPSICGLSNLAAGLDSTSFALIGNCVSCRDRRDAKDGTCSDADRHPCAAKEKKS